MNISQKTITKFIAENLEDQTFKEFAESDELKQVIADIKDKKDIRATKSYIEVCGASMEEAMMVVRLLKSYITEK